MALIPAAYQPAQLVAPSQKVPYTDPKTGHLGGIGWQQAGQVHSTFNGTSRRVPCSCDSSAVANTFVLSPNPGGPQVRGYFDYEEFAFVADVSSSGTVLATVVPNGPGKSGSTLPTLPVYKNNGGTAAAAGDVVSGRQYNLTFADSLNGGNGGFVLR